MTLLGSLWSPVEVQREVAHPVEAVFAAVADPFTYPQWLVGAQRIRAVDDDFPAVGSRFHHSVGVIADATVDDRSEVLAVDPPNRLEMRVEVGPVNGVVELLIEARGDGSLVRIRERPDGLASVLTPFTRVALAARNAESLRRLDGLLHERSLTHPEPDVCVSPAPRSGGHRSGGRGKGEAGR